MDIFEQKAVLESFQILVDTREQDTAKSRKRYAAFGVPFRKETLPYGDYAYDCTLPNGKPLYTGAILPPCVIERKMSLDELAGCFTRGRARFKREFDRAASNNSKVYLLCENSSYEGILNGRYRSRFNENAFLGSLLAWAARYDISVVFCREETSGRLIKEILYRDLKERLERGEYG